MPRPRRLDARKSPGGGGGTGCHTGQFQVTLQGPLASASGAQESFNTTTLTCSNVYCHASGPQLEIGGGKMNQTTGFAN